MKTSIICSLFLLLVTVQVTAENYPYRTNVLWVTTPNHTDWLYKTGEKATVTVSVYEYGIMLNDVEISYSIGQDCLDADTSGTVKLKNGKAEINVGTMQNPGFRDCRLSITLGNRTYKHHIKLGFSPEKINLIPVCLRISMISGKRN